MTDPREVLDRPAPEPDATVAYGDHPLQLMDIYAPVSGTPSRPLVVFIHGGFWQPEYDRVHTRPLAVALAGRGHAVANIDYRRVGSGGWPATGEDVAAAVTHAPRLVAVVLAERGDPVRDTTRPIVAGHSAGGHLALWAGRRLGPGAVRGVLGLAPVADLRAGYARGLGGGAVGQFLGGSPDRVPDAYAAADPTANLPLGVPAIVVHGDEDRQVPYEMGRGFVDAAHAAGDPVDAVRFEGLAGVEHFALIDPLSAAWPAVAGALAELAVDADGETR